MRPEKAARKTRSGYLAQAAVQRNGAVAQGFIHRSPAGDPQQDAQAPQIQGKGEIACLTRRVPGAAASACRAFSSCAPPTPIRAPSGELSAAKPTASRPMPLAHLVSDPQAGERADTAQQER